MALVGLVVMGILAMVVLAEEDLVDLMEVAQQVAHMVVVVGEPMVFPATPCRSTSGSISY